MNRDVQDPDELAPASTEAVSIAIHNLERGQVVEAVVVGRLDEAAVAGLGRQLHTLAAQRQPMTLYLDLTDAELRAPAPVDAITAAASTLDGFGGRLVVRNADLAFERSVPPERLGRSLAFERSDGSTTG